jgi:hypothetical protein
MAELVKRFLEYAAAFERAYAARDFAALGPFFSEDACYEIHAEGEPVRRHAGRDAVLGYLAFVTEHFDRRFAERKLVHLDGPHLRGNAVETHGMALYRLPSGACCHLPMTETAHFRGDVIERLVDRLSPGGSHEMRVFVLRHPDLFPPALLDPTGPAA